MVQDFLPDIVSPVGCDWADEESLELDVASHEFTMHAHTCGCGSFAVEISTAGEVVQGRLKGELVISPRIMSTYPH